ncbi:MAG: NADPH-dependent FMN reductase [Thiohalomonadales bacterium]
MEAIKILAISGSLRKKSYNTALLRATELLAPEGIEVKLFSGLGQLPLFNPDREQEKIPAVVELKKEMGRCDGLLIASPEYAHGISAVLKNALDWLVSGPEFPNLPVALYNTSPRATHAQVALREVLNTMSANIIEPASIIVPLLGSDLDRDGILKHIKISHTIRQSMCVFRDAIIEKQSTEN